MGIREDSTKPINHLSRAFQFAIGTAVIIFLLSPLLKNNPPVPSNNTPSPTKAIGPSNTLTMELTFTPTVSPFPLVITDIATSTPSRYPTPFAGSFGSNLPDGFDVLKWLNNYVKCDKNRDNHTVEFYGVIFSNGDPSYQYHFSFWRSGKSFMPTPVTPTSTPLPVKAYPTVDRITTAEQVILFDKVVNLIKGEYYHVIISVDWEKGVGTWVDDLYYPNTKYTPHCPQK